MKIDVKKNYLPLKLTLEFETLEELQAFESIFQVSAIIESEFIAKHLDTENISDSLPRLFKDEQVDQLINDLELHYGNI
jgi:hypothetical protein